MQILKGIDGNWYAVFKDEYSASLEWEFFKDYYISIACFGNYYNAYKLTDNGTVIIPNNKKTKH